MTPPALKQFISSADTQIIREELLFEKFCVKADVYRTSDNSSQIIICELPEKSDAQCRHDRMKNRRKP